MTFTTQDMEKLNELMASSPENKELLTKLLDFHQYTVSKISHEIRNPLALVYSTLQLIESTHPEVLSIKHWHHMHEDVEYMTSLLEELTSYNNSNRLSVTDINMCTYMECLALSFAASLVDTNIEFTSKIDHNLPIMRGDKVKLREMLLNLFKNAKDAISSAGMITLHTYPEGDNVLIQISDTGCGIANENINDIFTPFVTYKQGGSGLGLAIAQKIADAHGGSIQTQSTLGCGTTFTVTLPIQEDGQQ